MAESNPPSGPPSRGPADPSQPSSSGSQNPSNSPSNNPSQSPQGPSQPGGSGPNPGRAPGGPSTPPARPGPNPGRAPGGPGGPGGPGQRPSQPQRPQSPGQNPGRAPGGPGAPSPRTPARPPQPSRGAPQTPGQNPARAANNPGPSADKTSKPAFGQNPGKEQAARSLAANGSGRAGSSGQSDSGQSGKSDGQSSEQQKTLTQKLEEAAETAASVNPAAKAQLKAALFTKKVVVAGIGTFLAFMMLASVVMVGGTGGVDYDAQHGTARALLDETDVMDRNQMRAYQAAARRFNDSDYGGALPWTIIAAVSQMATEHGKLSPYGEDTCDRKPSREPFRSSAATEDGCEGSVAVFPQVRPSIGSVEDASIARGPFLIASAALKNEHSNVNPQRIDIQGDFRDPRSGSMFIAFEMDRIRKQMVDDEGWEVPDVGDEEAADAFWEEVVSRLPIIDPRTIECLTPSIPEGASPEVIRNAVHALWHCELIRADLHTYEPLNEPGADSFEERFRRLNPSDAANRITREGVVASFAFSGHTSPELKVCGIDPNRDPEEPPPPPPPPNVPLGVFPLTEDVFKAYVVNPSATRCHAGDNIHAAVRAFVAGEVVPFEESSAPAGRIGDRSESLGPFAPMVGGWFAMPWVLGSEIDRFYEVGPRLPFEPTDACRAAVSVWVDTVASADSTASRLAEYPAGDRSVEVFEPLRDAVAGARPQIVVDECGDRDDGAVESLASGVAYSKFSATLVSSDDTTEGDEGTPEDLLEELSPSSTVVEDEPGVEPADDRLPGFTTSTVPPSTVPGPTVPGLTVPDTSVPGSSPSSTVPSTSVPFGELDVAERLSLSLDGVSRLFVSMAESAPVSSLTPAARGSDVLVHRLSPSGRSVADVPTVTAASSSYTLDILKVAVLFGGIVEDDERFDRDVDLVAALGGLTASAFASGAGGAGGTIAGLPPVASDAFSRAVVWSGEMWPSCSLSMPVLAGFARIESGMYWMDGPSSRLQPDGESVPHIIGARPPTMLRDTDGGALDGMSSEDRAVGFTQFIPSTWNAYASRMDLDGNGDGVVSPHNFYDGARATAAYVCERVSAPPSWWTAADGEASLENEEFLKKVAMSYFAGDGGVLRAGPRTANYGPMLVGFVAEFKAAYTPGGGSFGGDGTLVGDAIAYAMAQVGKPYCRDDYPSRCVIQPFSSLGKEFRGQARSGPDAYDCSGLVWASYTKAGLSMPNSTTRDMLPTVPVVPMSDLQPGDLIFYGHNRQVSHVAMFIGNGQIVHARSHERGVVVDSMDYWRSGIMQAGRPSLFDAKYFTR